MVRLREIATYNGDHHYYLSDKLVNAREKIDVLRSRLQEIEHIKDVDYKEVDMEAIEEWYELCKSIDELSRKISILERVQKTTLVPDLTRRQKIIEDIHAKLTQEITQARSNFEAYQESHLEEAKRYQHMDRLLGPLAGLIINRRFRGNRNETEMNSRKWAQHKFYQINQEMNTIPIGHLDRIVSDLEDDERELMRMRETLESELEISTDKEYSAQKFDQR